MTPTDQAPSEGERTLTPADLWQRQLAALERQRPMCADHRDKFVGKVCVACEVEHRKAAPPAAGGLENIVRGMLNGSDLRSPSKLPLRRGIVQRPTPRGPAGGSGEDRESRNSEVKQSPYAEGQAGGSTPVESEPTSANPPAGAAPGPEPSDAAWKAYRKTLRQLGPTNYSPSAEDAALRAAYAVDHVAPAAAGEPQETDEPPALWTNWFSCEDCHGWFWGEAVAYDSGANVCDSCAEKRERVAAPSAEREGLADFLVEYARRLRNCPASKAAEEIMQREANEMDRAAAALRARPGEEKP